MGQSEVNKDAAAWFELNVEKKLTSNFDLGLNQQLRLNYNFSEVGRNATEIYLARKISENVKITGGYVLLNNRNLDESFTLSHRLFVSTSYDINWNLLNIQYRIRYQQNFLDLGELSGESIRNRFQIRYTLNKRWKPFASYEIFYRIRPNAPNGFNSERFVLGCAYKVSKQFSIESYYLWRNELNATNETDRDYVVGLKALFKL